MTDIVESERTAGYWLGYHDGEKSGRSEAAAEIEQLRAALEDILSYVPHGDLPLNLYDKARAALEG